MSAGRTYQPWLPAEDEALVALLRAHGDDWRPHLAEYPVLAGRGLPTIGSRIWQKRRQGDPRFVDACGDDPGPPWPRRGEPWPDAGNFFAGRDSRRASLDLGSPRYEFLPPEPLYGQSSLRSALARYVR